MERNFAKIRGIKSVIPDNILTNEKLALEFEAWPAAKILEKTGILQRGIAAQNQCSSDLGYEAACLLLEAYSLSPLDFDFLLFCTQSPDYFLPTTACLLQDRLKMSTRCGALDYNLGCSGFVYGLSLAKGLIETEVARNVLLITAETYSKFIHPKDKSVRTLFGDGASATWVGAVQETEEQIKDFVFGTDGRGAKNLIVPAGGMRLGRSQDSQCEVKDDYGNVRTKDHLFMDGPEILAFTLSTVPYSVSEVLKKACIHVEQVDYFVFHQANRFMLEALRTKLKLPRERFCIEMESFGNTVSSTIPMALEKLEEKKLLKRNSLVMLVGFGVGYSWGACLVRI